MRILIVEESPERTEVLREGLERAGYEVADTVAWPLELLSAVDTVGPKAQLRDR